MNTPEVEAERLIKLFSESNSVIFTMLREPIVRAIAIGMAIKHVEGLIEETTLIHDNYVITGECENGVTGDVYKRCRYWEDVMKVLKN